MKRLAAGLTAVLVLGLPSCGFSGHDESWAVALEPGQCGDPVPPKTSDEVAQVRVVDCKRPHGLEVYALVTYQDPHRQPSSVREAKYPGQEDLARFGREACAGKYRAYLGDAAPSPDQYLTFLYPSVSSWTAFKAPRPNISWLKPVVGESPKINRKIICIVQSAGPNNLKGSVRTPQNGKTS